MAARCALPGKLTMLSDDSNVTVKRELYDEARRGYYGI